MRRVWTKIKTRELPLIESLHDRLVRHCPPQRYTGLVHNDYRLGNLMLDDGNRVAAVLDWELTAIGDVLADLGALLNNWDGPEDPGPDIWMQPAPTRAGGFPTRNELVSSYARQSGFDVSDLDYYRALSYWRIAIIGEGMMRRYQSGEMAAEGADLTAIDKRVRDRAELADEFLRAFVS
jgi:aminoglycoside phosphotransferase (APT) family kinase protein